MADTKITQLATLTSLASTDLLVVVDDPGGTPVSKSTTMDAVTTYVEDNGVISPSYAITASETSAGVTPVDYSYPPGNVLRYAVNSVPGTTDMLAAFNAAHDQFLSADSDWYGGEVVIPEGKYYLSNTWVIQKQLHIRGAGSGSHVVSSATALHFPADCDGLRLHSSVETGFDSAAGTTIRDLCVYCKDRQTTGHGIHMTARVFLENLLIDNFAENGIYIFGSSAGGTGAPNQWTVRDIDSQNNGGHGIYVDGDDTNAGMCSSSNFKSNLGWGIYDSSFLGNVYNACHINDNHVGSVKSEGSSNDSIFIGIYVEGAAQSAPEIDAPAMTYGGELAGKVNVPILTITGDGTGAAARAVLSGDAVDSVQVTAQGSGYTTITIVEYEYTGYDPAGETGGSGSGATFTGNLTGGKLTSVTVNTGGSGYAGSTAAAHYIKNNGTAGGVETNETWFRKRPQSAADGYIKMCAAQDGLINLSSVGSSGTVGYLAWDDTKKTYNTNTNNSAASANVSRRIVTDISTTETGGRSAVLTQGSLEFPNGLWLGDGTTGRQLSSSSTMPSSGEYAKGDFVFNTNPSEAGSPAYVVLGWSRLVTGTAHVLNTDWVEMRCVTGN